MLLNEEFYRALREHPVPVSESALRAIGPRSAVIDIYVWLAYRLHALTRDVEVSWPALYAQFGSGYARLRSSAPPSPTGWIWPWRCTPMRKSSSRKGDRAAPITSIGHQTCFRCPNSRVRKKSRQSFHRESE